MSKVFYIQQCIQQYIKLPWINLYVVSFLKNKVFAEHKENLDIGSICGKEYNFFSQIYYYLKKIREKNESIDFNILFELIKLAKSNENLSSFIYSEKYIFIEKLKLKLNEFRLLGKNAPNDKKLVDLFKPYPIDYYQLYESPYN